MIRVLEKNVSDKIAAGEVIERPVSIVKELVENSIDAGSTSVTIEIKNGGKTYIRVTDNGSGIHRDEVETAFLRHATSKIETSSDLGAIKTLGFRGEALASIAAVTRTTLITKTTDEETGTKLSIDGGTVISKEAVGTPTGTTIIVTDLFYNTPARREFLKNDAAESSLISDFVSELSIAFPNIRFSYISNSKMVFTSTGSGDIRETVLSVYRKSEYRDLIEINTEKDGIRIRGLISRPSLSRTTKREQYFIVNGRVVESKVIEKALMKGYRERLFEGRYPVAFLVLDIKPESLDVNIHPNKKEIRFHDENVISEAVTEAVREELATQESVIKVRDYFKDEDTKNDIKTEQVDVKKILSNRPRQSGDEGVLKEPEGKLFGSYDSDHYDNDTPAENCISFENSKDKQVISSDDFDLDPGKRDFDFDDLRITGCIFDTYITLEDGKAFYLIDQHAAHERVFYEKLVGAYLSGDKPSQILLAPETIDVSPADVPLKDEWMPLLTDMGYSIEEFGPSTFLIKEIPVSMELGEAIDFAIDFISSSSELGGGNNKVVIDKLITRSCKSAVKAHDHLSMEEMEALLKDLSSCRNPFSCPHGRPTVIKFTRYEIEKFFKRIQ